MDEQERGKPTLLGEFYENAEALALTFAAMLLIFVFLIRPATVDGSSMEPTLRDGEQIMISRLLYEPRQGDVVVVANTADHRDHKNLIKRIIALGGQTVDIDFDTGEVWVDGQLLDEPYILEPTLVNEGMDFPLTVPPGEVFAMGDNRNNSRDSRSPDVGTFREEEIVGRCLFRYLPLDRFGGLNDSGRAVFE